MPNLSNKGPPLFPGCIGAEIVKSVGSELTPSSALIIPSVIFGVLPRMSPSGYPIAKICSPTS